MGTKTEYYDFNLPADTDYADQNQFNENFETLDTTLHNMQSQINSDADAILAIQQQIGIINAALEEVL